MIRRALLAAVLVAVSTVGWDAGTLPATADDPTPAATPPPVPDPTGGGPTYVITPGVGGSELPAPADPDEVERARKADQEKNAKESQGQPTSGSSGSSPSPSPSSSATPVAVAGPQSPLRRLTHPDSPVGLLWRGIAAVVVVLVMFEITDVGRYLRRRRRPGVTEG